MKSTLSRRVAALAPFDLDAALASRAAAHLNVALTDLADGLRKIVDELRLETFAQREQAGLALAGEIARRLIRDDLQRIESAIPDEVTVKNQRYRRHCSGTVTYHSLVGDVAIARDVYRRVGVHNGPTIVPLELISGLMLGATPALAYSVAQGIADMPSRQYEETMHAACRRVPSRSTVERLAKNLGGAMKQDIELIEPIVRQTESVPKEAHAVVVGMDRVTVAMTEEIPVMEALKRPRKRTPEDYIRQPPPAFEVNFRMPFVGTVSLVDEKGEALEVRRFGATPEEGPADLVRRMMAEVKHLLAQKKMPVAIVQDGAEQLWGLMWDGLRSIGVQQWHQAIDCYHVLQHMNDALDAARISGKHVARKRYIDKIDQSDFKVMAFCRWLLRKCEDTCWHTVAAHYNYLIMAHISRRTRYATMRRLGLPIGSGTVEGTCKSLVTKRFKSGGQRWQQDGLTAILTLRSIRLSNRLPTFWSFFRNRYTAIVEWT